MLNLEQIVLPSGEAAKVLGVSPSYLRRLPKELLPYERVGHHRKYLVADLAAYDSFRQSKKDD
jgi:hypothetical protein